MSNNYRNKLSLFVCFQQLIIISLRLKVGLEHIIFCMPVNFYFSRLICVRSFTLILLVVFFFFEFEFIHIRKNKLKMGVVKFISYNTKPLNFIVSVCVRMYKNSNFAEDYSSEFFKKSCQIGEALRY